jgi:4-carboxymuconolactone decarboxylase
VVTGEDRGLGRGTAASLSARERRLVTIACLTSIDPTPGADPVGPVEQQVHDAWAAGELSLEEMLEVSLHVALYSGWPRSTTLDGATRAAWRRLHEERGEPVPAWPSQGPETLGPEDHAERLRLGRERFAEVNGFPITGDDSPYLVAGVLGIVFGGVWLRPNLSRRDRRLLSIACVGCTGAALPAHAHLGGALQSGDLGVEELDEMIGIVRAYAGDAKAGVLDDVAGQVRARLGG